ncbi:hypothetical protein llg_29200 [Luteolibacter sp. LG18]|nr:hypothetical protein llg_29200 [Luteolibacter sp. LG18]
MLVTLLMMVLLSTLALGLLSLSSITLRGSTQEAARMRARANARCALMLAIGQLQKNLGPDQRISAPAALAGGEVPSAHQSWSGVWKSDVTTPTSFPAGRQDRFASWLISAPQGQEGVLGMVGAMSGPSVALERLPDGRETRVPLLDAPEGRIAWWTADEAQKATVDLAEPTVSSDSAQLAARHAPPRFAPEAIASMGAFPKDAATANRLVTTEQIELTGIPPVPDLGRTCTVGARTLLTDVRKGGFKKDFSSLFEMPEADISGYGQWSGSNSINDAQAYVYGNPGVAIGARWNHLHAYYNLYKDVSLSNNEPRIELASKPLIDWHLADQQKDYGDKQGGFRYPRISRILYVFSYSAVPPTGTSTEFTLRLGVDVYVLLWNPFDVRITWPANTNFLCKFSSGLPFKFNWFVNGAQRGAATRLGDVIGTPGGLFLQSQFQMPGESVFNMAPGETRLFSLAKTTSTFQGGSYPDFTPGLYYNDLLFYDKVLGSGGKVTGVSSDRISVGMEPYNETSAYNNKAQYVDFWIYDRARGWPYYEHRGEIIAEGNTQFTQNLKPLQQNVLPSVTMAEAASKKKPFAAFIMEMKSAGDSTLGTPSFLYSGAGRLSSRLNNSNEDFSLDRLEYKLEKMESFQSDLLQCSLPGDPNGENHGYVGSGRLPMDGRTHMTSLSIPSMPPVSIANLRHASVGDGAACLRSTLWAPQSVSCTPSPSYTDQAVGNAYAHPRVPANATSAGSSGSTLYDHSYLVNEALWDGWFFSSLSSRAADGAAIQPKTMWSDFVDGKKPLLNPRFSLWKGTDTPEKLRTEVFDGSKIRLEAHRSIAARLLLNGGFNVNSTSVDAWTAFLSSTRARSIRKLNRTGSPGGELIQAKGTLFSRGDFVLDDPVEGGGDDSQYSGFRDLSDDQVRKLAAKVVDEVKKRGPFLNLSEFVNRRVGGDAELSLRGTLQAAIDATDLNDKLKALGKPGISSPPSGSFANTKAAELNTSTGAPGWLMQGDILDPLGPLITVRGDTFRIRAYGESTDQQGNVLARSWCEAVVQRTPDYLDKQETAQTNPPVRPVNLQFGREFRIVGFRWLNGPEA